MGKKVDLTGRKIYRLTVIEFSHTDGLKRYWKCICDCGKIVIAAYGSLTQGTGGCNTKSCGCLKIDQLMLRITKHGYCRNLPEYNIWKGMKARCYNINNKQYKDYGGRGIIVCDEWRNNFEQFYKDMGPRPSNKHSIDRIKNDGNYCDYNCRWATSKEQNNNTRQCINITYNGHTKTAQQWSDHLKIGRGIIYRRFHLGMQPEQIFKTNSKQNP
jgi:hypothetical protein